MLLVALLSLDLLSQPSLIVMKYVIWTAKPLMLLPGPEGVRRVVVRVASALHSVQPSRKAVGQVPPLLGALRLLMCRAVAPSPPTRPLLA